MPTVEYPDDYTIRTTITHTYRYPRTAVSIADLSRIHDAYVASAHWKPEPDYIGETIAHAVRLSFTDTLRLAYATVRRR